MYNKILVPLDGSELAECVLPHLDAIARGCGTSNVVFMRVVEPVMTPGITGGEGYTYNEEDAKRMEDQSRENAKDYLRKIMQDRKYDGASVHSVVTVGKAADAIADFAVKNEVDLIILATHGRSGVSRWVWGSVADRVLRSSCVPVFMIRAPGCVPGISG
ncbi:MAG: universal stress protein [Chloroflexi bacterium]|nr:universal stress protein [Chloroflexota bacterium]